MAISREAIIWAYRLFLGRDPENDAVLDQFGFVESLEQLCQVFVNSPEFIARSNILAVGKYLDVASIDIETSCSPADLTRMLAGIAKNWSHFGETEPHWSVLTNERFSQDNITENIEEFYESGFKDVNQLFLRISRSGLPERLGKVLDFGCGVGRLSLVLADKAESVTGIDISAGHLALARERAATTGRSNVSFERLSTVEDLSRYQGFDLVISLIVLQHNPPPVMAVLLRKLLNTLRPGGVAVLQIPTYLADYRFSVRDYLSAAQPEMEMNALPQHVIYKIADAAGCTMLEVREDGAIGSIGLSHTFAIRKR